MSEQRKFVIERLIRFFNNHNSVLDGDFGYAFASGFTNNDILLVKQAFDTCKHDPDYEEEDFLIDAGIGQRKCNSVLGGFDFFKLMFISITGL